MTTILANNNNNDIERKKNIAINNQEIKNFMSKKSRDE